MEMNADEWDPLTEIFSKKWKIRAFRLIAEANSFVTGYELSRRFSVSFNTAYRFIEKLEELGVVRYSKDGSERRKEVIITEYGKGIYAKSKDLLNLGR